MRQNILGYFVAVQEILSLFSYAALKNLCALKNSMQLYKAEFCWAVQDGAVYLMWVLMELNSFA